MQQSGEGVEKGRQKLAVCSGICIELQPRYLMKECHSHHYHIITTIVVHDIMTSMCTHSTSTAPAGQHALGRMAMTRY